MLKKVAFFAPWVFLFSISLLFVKIKLQNMYNYIASLLTNENVERLT